MRDYASLLEDLQLDLAISDGSAPLTSDMDVSTAARHSLYQAFYKKLAPHKTVSPSAEAAALAKFLQVNDKTAGWRLPALNLLEAELWNTFIGVFGAIFNRCEVFDLDFIREHMMCGPGAAQKADSSTYVTKLFQSRLSYYHPYTLSIYRSALVDTGLWADAEMARHRTFGEERVEGGKLFFVNKTSDIARTCCTEPSVDMLIQKSIGAYLEACLVDLGISLDTQPDFNRLLCREGSSNGSFGTIDLSSASDSISSHLVELLPLPPFLKGLMRVSASSHAILPDGSLVEKGMISTMGNGFTFPLQTLIFACAVKAVYTVRGLPVSRLGRAEYSVFGDDIIVRREAYETVTSFLELLGFTVNDTKSFNSGPFRESCGEDYFYGVNIRGVYIRSLETHQNVVSALNRLVRWSARHGVSLCRVLHRLKSWCEGTFLCVPPSEADDAGLHVPFGLVAVRVADNYWFKYRAWRAKRRLVTYSDALGDDTLGVGALMISGHLRRRDVFTNGGRCSHFHDYLPATSLRSSAHEPSFYKIARCAIPYWDFIPVEMHSDRIARESDSWGAWKAVLAGLIVR